MRKTTIVLLVLLTMLAWTAVANAQITSAGSGSWTAGATWIGGLVPTSVDDVLIATGHTISVDDVNAECRSVTFGADDALIDLNANSLLTVYGDFTIFSTSHVAFSGGWSGTNAFIKFAGSADQTLSGWSTTAGSTSFRDVIVDKSGGKLTTQGNGMRLGIQNSLEIVNGLFELAEGDDLEGRWASSGNYRNAALPDITIQSGGELYLADGSGVHHIRSSATPTSIGVVTIFGKATFRDASTNKITLAGIDVEDGGKLITSLGMGTAKFDCGPVVIKDGGELENYTTSDIWGASASLTIDVGGIYDTKSSTTIFPASFTDNGTVRYSRDSTTDQNIVDRDYNNLEVSLDTDNVKVWDLGADRSVAQEFAVNGSATLILTAALPQTLTVDGLLYLTSGLLDNSDANVTLTVADGTLVQRATGEIAVAPAFAGQADIRYTSTAAQVTTGPEVPVASGVITDFTVDGDQGVVLGADITVNGVCTTSGSDLVTGPYAVTLGGTATLVESPGATILGTAMTTRTVAQSVNETFGGLGLDILAAGAAPGLTTVTRVNGIAAEEETSGFLRYFEISPGNNTGLDATVVFHYDDSELNGATESLIVLFADNGGGYVQQASSLDGTANEVTGSGQDSLYRLTLAEDSAVPAMLRTMTAVVRGMAIDVSWQTSWLVPEGDFLVYRSADENWDAVDVELEITTSAAGSSYRFVDRSCKPGASYRYRVDVSGNGGSTTLFETKSIIVQSLIARLDQNVPNPFNPMTEIKYTIPEDGKVTLDIFDIRGRLVVRLVDSVRTAGSHVEMWTGLDGAGNPVPSGTYFYQMATDNRQLIKKMMLVR